MLGQLAQVLVEEIQKFACNFKDQNFVRNVFLIVFIICGYLVWTCPCYGQTEHMKRKMEKRERYELARLFAKTALLKEHRENNE
ncbi:hypothetical protein PMAYCL1PPCAC_30787, partial [Pristionchus mayeri]